MAGQFQKGLNFDPQADLIDPLDYRILGALKPEGTMVLDLYPDGHTARQLARETFGSVITAPQLSPRLSALKYHKLIAVKKGIGTNGAQVYQRTKQGTQVHEEWAKKQSGELMGS